MYKPVSNFNIRFDLIAVLYFNNLLSCIIDLCIFTE